MMSAVPPSSVPVVLVVEDEPDAEARIRRACATLLPVPSLRCCRTGAEGIDALHDPSFRPDLALIDLGLPDIGGIDVIRVARDRHPDLPIVVLSLMSTERIVLDAVRAGAHGYLLKDEADSTLAASIAQAIRGEYPISPAIARFLFDVARGVLRTNGPAFRLSAKEAELLEQIAWGASYAEAAQRMGIAISTVQTHIRNLYRKLEAHSRDEAVARARDHGLL